MRLQHFGARIGPLPTTDTALVATDVARVMAGIKETMGNQDMGVLDPIDVGRIVGIMRRYSSGGGVGTTNRLGVTTPDSSAAHAADAFHREVEHNRKVAKGYADFWKEKSLASLQRFGSRR